MKSNSLFNILVLGGGLLSASAGWAQESSQPLPVDEDQVVALAFCAADNSNTCEVAVVDNQCKSVPKQGVTCCWGTSCD